MSNRKTSNSGRIPVTSADEVRVIAGSVTDHTVVEIMSMQPSINELEIAALYASGETGALESSSKDLTGTAALLYDVLMQDEVYGADDR